MIHTLFTSMALVPLAGMLLATTTAAATVPAYWVYLPDKDIPGQDAPQAPVANVTSAAACGDAALAGDAYIAVWVSDSNTCHLKSHTTPQPATEIFLGHTPSTPPFLGYYDLPGGTGAFTTKMAHMNYFRGREWSAFQEWSSECDVWSYTLSERMYRCKRLPDRAGSGVVLRWIPQEQLGQSF